jgi:uncharacterized protein YceK
LELKKRTMKKLTYLLLLFVIPMTISCGSILSSNDPEEEEPQVEAPIFKEGQAGTDERDDEPITPPPPFED